MRVKRGTIRARKRKNVLKKAKGYLNRRSTHLRAAREAILHAGKYAYRDRRALKRDMRSLWNIRINAAAREHGMSYSQLINKLKKSEVKLDRKSLSELAVNSPKVFEQILKQLT